MEFNAITFTPRRSVNYLFFLAGKDLLLLNHKIYFFPLNV